MNYILTRNGHRFDLSPARIGGNRIELDDVVTALAKQCCYRGHCPGFFSLAEFSILVSYLVPAPLALPGLLHLSASAYLGYSISPNQVKAPDLQATEYLIHRRVCEVLGVPRTTLNESTWEGLRGAIALADAICLDTFMGQYLLPTDVLDLRDERFPDGIPSRLVPQGLDWADARLAFLDRYHNLIAVSKAQSHPDNVVPLRNL